MSEVNNQATEEAVTSAPPEEAKETYQVYPKELTDIIEKLAELENLPTEPIDLILLGSIHTFCYLKKCHGFVCEQAFQRVYRSDVAEGVQE